MENPPPAPGGNRDVRPRRRWEGESGRVGVDRRTNQTSRGSNARPQGRTRGQSSGAWPGGQDAGETDSLDLGAASVPSRATKSVLSTLPPFSML